MQAQDAGGTYDRALRELQAGRKESHWMWFVFPQLAGLGRSTTAQRYAVGSVDEAQAYLAHPVLGPRLRACAEALLALPGNDAAAVLAHDEVKLHSSMTLFAQAAPDEALWRAVLDRYFTGRADDATVDLLRSR